MPGKFEFYCGPMFSGKTEYLLTQARKSEIAGKNIIICKPKVDTRTSDGVVCSHNKRVSTCRAISGFSDILPIFANSQKRIDCVFIDEVQFLTEMTIKDIRVILDKYGADLFVSGLALDSYREPFAISKEILPYAQVMMFSAVCTDCGSFNAIYTHRLSDNDKSQILIGDSNLYTALCSVCYNKEHNEEANSS